MKILVYSALLFIILAPSAFSGEIYDFELKDLDNKSVSYKELRGEKLTVIDFWATWCKPCVRSIPKLVELHSEFRDKGVSFIGISTDSPRNVSKVRPMARSLKISYPVLLDINGDVSGGLQINVLPTLFIVNADDEIVAVHRGYRPGDEDVLRSEIRDLLSGKDDD